MSGSQLKVDAASRALKRCEVLRKLAAFDPKLVSTIFVGLDTEESDIDIVCCSPDFCYFTEVFEVCFSGYDGYRCTSNDKYCLGTFTYDGFLFEVYASSITTSEQPAFLHYQIMQRLVALGGESFKRSIVALKHRGMKTEPAICLALGLQGNPYEVILQTRQWSDEMLKSRMCRPAMHDLAPR